MILKLTFFYNFPLNQIKLKTSLNEDLDTLVRVTFNSGNMQRITVYPNVDSFDVGNKRTGGLCGNWRKKTSPQPACNLYYKEGGVDICSNGNKFSMNSFKNYWR
jgi:hypothetical protein